MEDFFLKGNSYMNKEVELSNDMGGLISCHLKLKIFLFFINIEYDSHHIFLLFV